MGLGRDGRRLRCPNDAECDCSDRLRTSAWHGDRADQRKFGQFLTYFAVDRDARHDARYGGFSFVVSQGNPIEGLPNSFIAIGQGTVDGIGWPVIISLIVFVLGSLYLLVSVSGLRVFALGGNREASRSAGIRTGRLTIGIFTWNGVVIAMVAILQTAQLAEGAPQVGVNFALVVLTAVILGGVSFLGGIGRPAGVFLGVFTLEVLNAGLIFIGVDDWWQQIAAGSVLVFALAGDEFLRRRKVRTGRELSLALLSSRFRRRPATVFGSQASADPVVEAESSLGLRAPIASRARSCSALKALVVATARCER